MRPNLARMSCPPALHGPLPPPSTPSTATSKSKALPIKISVTKRPQLGRSSMSSPRTTSPRTSSPFAGSAPSTLFEKLLERHPEGEEGGRHGMVWSERVDSAALNQQPDAPMDVDAYRHGSFRPDDPGHAMHLIHQQHTTSGCSSPMYSFSEGDEEN